MNSTFLRQAALMWLLSVFCILTAKAQCTWFTKLSVNNYGNHTLGIKSDGTLWAWGNNEYGQLGNGTDVSTAYPTSPVQIGADNNWVSVSAGARHSAGLKADGSLWTWGFNNDGQLGDGSTTLYKTTPNRIGSETWKAVAAGGYHTLAIKSDGSLWAWGYNNGGQLGNNTNVNSIVPVPVGVGDKDWVFVAAGHFYSMAIKRDGTLWGWGINYDGQLGFPGGGIIMPVRVGTASNWASVATGWYHTVGIKTDGTIWAMGENGDGQLGIGSTTDKKAVVQIGTSADWVSVAVGNRHSLGIKADGTLWAWGSNGRYQLGDGSTTTSTSPVRIGSASNWALVTGGALHSEGLRADGSAYVWGDDANWQLGNGARNEETVPWQLAATGFTLPVVSSSITKTQEGYTNYNNNCTLIASVIQTAGSTAISGSTTAKVWIENTQPFNYVKRHYEILPVANANTATGRVTLYFTQQEFTDFNAVNSVKLPVDATDAANNKANLLIEKIGGTSSNGLPVTYSGTSTTINPADVSIVWNSTDSRWEVTFVTTGFGGFFLKTQTINLINAIDKASLARSTPAAVAYSLRLLSSTYTGYAIRVRRSNDNNTQDIGFTSDGSLDTVALKNFTGVNSGYVIRWYDQSGNGLDAEQTDVSKQPLIVTAGIIERLNRKPAVYFGTANLATVKRVIFTNGASMVGVAKGNSSVPSAFITKTGTAAGANLHYPSPFDYTNSSSEFTVGNAATPTHNVINAGNSTPRSVINNQVNGSVYGFVIPTSGTYYNYVNGVQAGSETVNGFQDNGNSVMLGNRNDGGGSGNFWTPEVLLFNLALSTTDRQTAEAALETYYFPATLPLSWLSVKGQLTDSKMARITWQVNETFVKDYQVEKSDDGISYAIIGQVSSTGDGVNNYSLTEPRVLSGTGYYRIRQTDMDGQYTYSPVIKLSNETAGRLTVFPNPANDIVTVTVGSSLLNSVATLHNTNGQTLQSHNISATSFTINLANLPAGIYYLRTVDGKVEKIFKK